MPVQTRKSRKRPVAVVAALALAATTLGGIGAASAGAATTEPPLRLVAASSSVTLDRFPEEGVYLDLPVHLVAGANPFEIWAKRTSYSEPITASKAVWRNGRKRFVPLPAGLVRDFGGLSDFTHVTITNADGDVVADLDRTFCPNNEAVRTRPDAPDRSPYPAGCSGWNPFTIGSVWGLQSGWGAKAEGEWWDSAPLDLPDGSYTATVSVNEQYRELFGVPANQSSATIAMTVRTSDCGGPFGCLTAKQQAAKQHAATQRARSKAPQPAASRPTGKGSVPKGPKPDLRSLPAWNIVLTDGSDDEDEGADEPTGDYLTFNATVWTGGTSPMVVDGFRRSGEDIMDAYQYFYDSAGNQTGYAQVGTMEWDARDGHTHWHFTDFAQYRLLDENKQLAVRSDKEAFCLANTDAVDYTLPKANWRPDNTDLHTACGDYGSLAVREVLDVGSGDTYSQYLPGQSFNVTDLPNGTYYVEVSANPDHRLYEQDLTNNVSYRKVILGGVAGARTVEVPPYEGIEG
ncbi:lysyl oxidase family protein [Flindersiella endophytica]